MGDAKRTGDVGRIVGTLGGWGTWAAWGPGEYGR